MGAARVSTSTEQITVHAQAYVVCAFGTASDCPDLAAVAGLDWEREAERWTYEPPLDLALFRERLERDRAALSRMWLATDEHRRAVALAELRARTGRKTGWARVYVAAGARRRGIGHSMLRILAAEARSIGVETLRGQTNSRVPSGEAFVTRFGCHPLGSHGQLEALVAAPVTTDEATAYVDQWLAHSSISITASNGPYPDSDAPAAAVLLGMIAERFDERVMARTLEEKIARLRGEEALFERRGVERWAVTARVNGALVGLNHYLWDRLRPTVTDHGGIAVVPEYRNGLLAYALVARARPVFVSHGVHAVRYESPSLARASRSPRGFVETSWEVSVARILAA